MSQENQKKKKKILYVIIALILLLLFIVVLVKLYGEFRLERERLNKIQNQTTALVALRDSLCLQEPKCCDILQKNNDLDSLLHLFEECQAIMVSRQADSLRQHVLDSLCQISPQWCEQLSKISLLDSLQKLYNSLQERSEQDNQSTQTKCNDTIAPWVYPEPSGGLYSEAVKISFMRSEPCSIYYRRSESMPFRHYNGEEILISQNTTLFYRAVDSCGNVFDGYPKKYEIRSAPPENICPENMAFIESSQENFCIDQYEWPNKHNSRPTNNVSHSEARDSCTIAGKRLCTVEEWETACRGPYNWPYPYGKNYAHRACVTQNVRVQPSGDAGECRGWYPVYDMVGNLAEWTDTRAPENNRFFIVKGGFWESGKTASCSMSRYSYYPQNRHNPVGFRCCTDTESSHLMEQ